MKKSLTQPVRLSWLPWTGGAARDAHARRYTPTIEYIICFISNNRCAVYQNVYGMKTEYCILHPPTLAHGLHFGSGAPINPHPLETAWPGESALKVKSARARFTKRGSVHRLPFAPSSPARGPAQSPAQLP
jgi:hypothetical protein